jgi:hypothetical protein
MLAADFKLPSGKVLGWLVVIEPQIYRASGNANNSHPIVPNQLSNVARRLDASRLLPHPADHAKRLRQNQLNLQQLKPSTLTPLRREIELQVESCKPRKGAVKVVSKPPRRVINGFSPNSISQWGEISCFVP